MRAVVGLAVRRLRAAPGRTALAALGVLAAAAMAGTAITVAVSLSGGFGRAARQADLPDVLARFGQRSRRDVDRRVGALPNLAGRSYRLEINNVPLAAGAHSTGKGAVEVPLGGRRGYAIVAGRDLSGRPGEVVIERGLADEWGVAVGDRVSVGRLGPQRVVGVSLEPSNVAFPLASAAHVYLPPGPLARRFGPLPVNVALLWVNDRARLDETLVQARAVSYGLTNLRLVTRDGVRVIVGQAGGIVIALLGAFSLVTLAAAGLMLGAAASADVQRRMPAIAVQRAVGLSRGRVTAAHAVEGAIVALPAAATGLGLGALITAGPADRLLRTLNEVGAGAALLGWLVLGGLALVAITAAASAWPAWRAAGRPPATVLRGGDLGRGRRRKPANDPRGGGGRLRRRRARSATSGPPVGGDLERPRARSATSGSRSRGGFLALGARLGAARRGRLAATVVVLASSAAVALLLLSLASLLQGLSDDPALLGRRYQLTVALAPSAAAQVRRIPGVAAVAPRRVVEASDAFSLGEPLRLIAYPGDHTVFEAPPLARGRRRAGPGEAEVGSGLAEVLGLRPGSTLAVALPSGEELRYRVVGIVRALDNDGRIAYVGTSRLIAAGAGGNPSLAVRLAPGANRATVSRDLSELTGVEPRRVGGASTSNQSFLAVLAGVLRAVAAVTGVLCLYALAQALALTARERRGTVALLRSFGAGFGPVLRVFAGAALVAAVPAALAGFVIERVLLGPAVANLAADYADLPLGAGPGQAAVVLAALALVTVLAAGWTVARALREPLVAGLREE